MTRCWRCRGLKLAIPFGIASLHASLVLVGGGAIATSGDCARAQITPDDTLPNNSIVTPQGNTRIINGGHIAGSNLFHSFEEFSVPTGGAAYFNNVLNIQNIISRVTGESISNIDGLLRANGTANLFLLNPNGIIFGPNATLSIGGSFVGSTASTVNFADGTQFSATAVQTTPLLTVSVPLGLQFGGNGRSIQNQSQATNSNDELVGLKVQLGKTLALVGGDVKLEGGILQAPGGQVELGGLAGAGTVGLSIDGNNLRLSFPDGVTRANVFLTDRAGVNVAAGGGGSIAVNARNLEISGGSRLFAGIDDGLGSVGTIAGNIEIIATEQVTIAGTSPTGSSSRIVNEVGVGAIGNSGDINIHAESLFVTNGAHLSASTFGQGDAGSVTIGATDTVSFKGGDAFSTVEEEAVGNSGGINITTRSLFVTNGAGVQTRTRGHGDAGSVTIRATDTISFDGVSSDGFNSVAVSQVESGAVGKGGSIDITTGSLSVTNGAVLATSTLGHGDAGSVTIRATDTISFDGVGSDRFNSGAASQVVSGAVGKGGSIDITTGSLSVTNGAVLAANTLGRGDAGSVTIRATDTISFDGVGSNGRSTTAFSSVAAGAVGKGGSIDITTGWLSVTNSAVLAASTHGHGDAGSVMIRATDTIYFNGESAALSDVEMGAVGKGGSIDIQTGSLFITNGAQLNAQTRGQGDAGSVTIRATDTVSFDGVSSNGLSSTAFSWVEAGAVGNGGDINITTGLLSVTDGALLFASTFGQGNAGSVNINVRDTVSFDGVGSNGFPSAATSEVVVDEGVGKGGDINITARSLSVTNGAGLSSSIEGNGAAGNIEVSASSIRLDNEASLSSDTTAGQGNITLNSQGLVMRRGSNITTNATRTATGGNITIDTGVIVALENSDISANAQEAFGGRVIIDAQGIFGTEFREDNTSQSDITATSELGPQFSGIVEINTPDVDPSSGLVNLPNQPTETEVVQACQPGGSQQQSEFVVTGRGGLPPNPGDSLSTDAVQVDLITLNPEVEQPSTTAVSKNPISPTPAPIVEAQGWVINAKGQIVLTAHVPTVTPHSSWQKPSDCHVPQKSS